VVSGKLDAPGAVSGKLDALDVVVGTLDGPMWSRDDFGNERAQARAFRDLSAPRIERMPIPRRIPSGSPTHFDAEAVRRLAERQHGLVSRKQLLIAGFGSATIARWLAGGRLHRIHPGVYALGHSALSLDGRLIAALLYGGDQAVFSHTTAAWIWALIDTEPTRIHLTTPGRRRSLPDVRVHHSRRIERAMCRDLPVTSVPRTLVDLASMITVRQLRRALAEADYLGLIDAGELTSVLGKGRRGSSALRTALDSHLPQLAETLSVLEKRFLELCREAGLPLPEVNARVGRMRVNALWRYHGLAVELDGGRAHGGAAAMKRDRERELALRAAGLQVVRYTWDQVTRRPEQVIADLRRLLSVANVRPSAGL
jgi:predicted transcriptional regulator of viral defense system